MKKILIALLVVASLPMLARADALTGNLLINPGAETGDLSSWTAGGDGNPQVDNGSFNPGINPHTGSYDFVGGYASSRDWLSQTAYIVTQNVTTQLIDSGKLTAGISFWEQGLNQGSQSDDGFVELNFLDGSLNLISTIDTPEIDSHNGTWENYANDFAIPVGTRYITYNMEFKRYVGSDLDAYFDDNSLVIDGSVPEPLTLSLMGSAAAISGFVRRRKHPLLKGK